MRQALKEDPKTIREAEEQRGPIPLAAIALMIFLAAAFALYFIPPLVGVTDQQVYEDPAVVQDGDLPRE